MFYPHTIKGKPTFKFVPVVEPPTEGPPLGGLQGWMQGDAGLTKDLSVNDYTVTNTNVTIGTQLNGHDTFRYNGSDAVHSFGINLGTLLNYTVTAVISVDSPNETNLQASLWGADTHWASTVIDPDGSSPGKIQTRLADDSGGGLGEFRHSITDNQELTGLTYHIITTRYKKGNLPTEILIDGVLVDQSQVISAFPIMDPVIINPFTIGGFSSFWLEGNIAEILIYDSYLDGALYTDKIDYLTERYNL